MSKLSFRARALDPSKPMPIFLAEELPDLPEYSAINRAVPQMPSGMEKEEESEHHLQRAICTGLIIPTPEVFEATDSEFYERYYPQDYKMPKQLIHMQPLNLEQDVPDYDMDSADELFVNNQGQRLELDPLKFETMMDRLEKSSGQTVVSLNEAKALLNQDDDVSTAVYDYWLNKRLKMQHPLILSVKTESRGNTTPNNPYLAFRRRTEKMQTRKNRKNDESSYEKMLKLRRDLSRAVTLLEMIKRREKMKREQLHLSIEIYEKRYQAQDFNGQMLAEFTSNATKASRPAFAPIYSNQYSSHHSTSGHGIASGSGVGAYGSGSSSQYHTGAGSSKRDNESLSSNRKEKRQYKKRKHKIPKERTTGSTSTVTGSSGMGVGSSGMGSTGVGSYHYQYHHSGVGLSGIGSTAGGAGGRDVTAGSGLGSGNADPALSSDEEELANLQGNAVSEEEYAYAFRRSKLSQYHRPITKGFGNWPWVSKEENGLADPRYRFTLTSLRHPRSRCIGFARRRIGRGGRVIIDRASTDLDSLWARLDYKIIESETTPAAAVAMEPDQNEESVVSSIPVTPVGSIVGNMAAAVVDKRKLYDRLSHSANKRRKQLVINEETELDELFMASFGLARRRRRSASTTEEERSRLGLDSLVEVKQEKMDDERTSEITATTVSSSFVISSNSGNSTSTSGNVNNSENNVIKSEVDDVVAVKQEVLEDYEHMIDNVNNNYRNRISNNSSSNSSSISSNVNNRNNFIQSFSNSISSSVQNGEQCQQQHSTSRSLHNQVTYSTASSGQLQSSENQDPGNSATNSDCPSSVYTDLLNEIQSSWLHFRPKTPEPHLFSEDEEQNLLENDPLLQTDANKISLELQNLGTDWPEDIFGPTESVYRTKQFALDHLIEPHPLGLEGSVLAASQKDNADELGIKLETCSNSDNNLSGDSLNDLNLSLNESNEDEKMLDKILQECQIDDMKSLNQTSNFWNGILEDGILNQLEATDDTGAGTGGDVKEDPLALSELVSPPHVEGDLPVNKVGYCSELVGYERPSAIERYKSKRRKILKRCNHQVGSSFFAVRNPPKEELFSKVADSEENLPVESEKENPTVDGNVPAEIKTEEGSEPASTVVPADQIKIEPPDELLAAPSPSPSHVTISHLQNNIASAQSVTSGISFHQSLVASPQIKLEPITHTQTPSAPAVSAATSFLITSPSVQVLQQQSQTGSATVINPMVATAQSTVPTVIGQQHPQAITAPGQITLATNAGSASSSGTSTPTGSYIVQHTKPIVLSQQQMAQIAATSGGNIVTVTGNQVVTNKQNQQIHLQHGHQGETYVLTTTPAGQSPLKKQINGPNEKTVKQNVINPKFHTLINQKLAAGQKAGDLNQKQLDMITKALVSSQKMIVKSATPANHGSAQVVQQQLQQQTVGGVSSYNVIHQSSLQQPITILSQNPQQSAQNKIILTSSPQLIQQAAGQIIAAAAAASPHGKIAINSNLVAAAGQQTQQAQFQATTDSSGQGQATSGGTVTVGGQAGQQQQHVKLEKTVNMLFDADKNRIVYANIKNSRGQFLAQINPKVVNIIQPIQQQKLVNNVGALQQQQQTQQHTTTSVQNLLGGSPTTAIVNSKGIQRIPAVSIRAQQLQQQQQANQQLDSHGTTTVALATNNTAGGIKFIHVTPTAATAAANVVSNENPAGVTVSAGNTIAATAAVVVPSSSGANGGATSGTPSAAAAVTTTPPTSINITNR